jgi:hypothetical protein
MSSVRTVHAPTTTISLVPSSSRSLTAGANTWTSE